MFSTFITSTIDVVTFACDRLATVLLSLDISAAYDTTDRSTLLDRITQDFAIRGSAIIRQHFFISERQQYVAA